jgi:beta-xylosidase
LVTVLAVVAVAVIVLTRAARTTPCDEVVLRSAPAPVLPSTQPPLGAPRTDAPRTPPVGESAIVRRLRAAIHGPSATVFCEDAPDPFVLRVGGSYYAYSTNNLFGNVPVLTAGGIFGRGAGHDALPALPAWSQPGRVWAPSVLALGGRFVMYYSTRVGGSEHKCLSVASSDDPEGPFVDVSAGPLVCPVRDDAIDPSPFVASNGQPYLLWRHGFTIVSQPLTADGLALTGAASVLISPDQPWEGGIVEAPSMIESEGRFYFFYSGNAWDTDRYAIGYAVCTTPQGPCAKQPGPWLSSSFKAQGPGGQELFTDESARPWMVLHAWIDGKVGYPNGRRNVFAVPLAFFGGVPQAG